VPLLQGGGSILNVVAECGEADGGNGIFLSVHFVTADKQVGTELSP
jgi:hypothetical protein